MSENPTCKTCRVCRVAALCLGGGIYSVNLGAPDPLGQRRPIAYMPWRRSEATLSWLLHKMLAAEVDWQCPRFCSGLDPRTMRRQT